MAESQTQSTPAREWTKGICGICPAGCWIEAAIEDGRLVDIRPDESHPLGMICRRGEHAPADHLLGASASAMGRSEEEAHCSVRLSLSHVTTEGDDEDALAGLSHVLHEMETTVRFLPCK